MKTDGLITRIGKWIDRTWEATATYGDLQEQEAKCGSRHIAALGLITDLEMDVKGKLGDLQANEQAKELADLKTRIEKIELYSGMTRKVDPTKPPVAKSAFSM